MSSLKDRFSAFVAGWCFAFTIAIQNDLRWVVFVFGVVNLLHALGGEIERLFSEEKP